MDIPSRYRSEYRTRDRYTGSARHGPARKKLQLSGTGIVGIRRQRPSPTGSVHGSAWVRRPNHTLALGPVVAVSATTRVPRTRPGPADTARDTCAYLSGVHLGSVARGERGQAMCRRWRTGVLDVVATAAARGPMDGLSEYADRMILAALDAIAAETKQPRAFIAGHSLGGTLASIFASLHADRLHGLISLEGPIQFNAAGGKLESAVAAGPSAKAITDVFGNVPGAFLSAASSWADPGTSTSEPMADRWQCWASPSARRVHWHVRKSFRRRRSTLTAPPPAAKTCKSWNTRATSASCSSTWEYWLGNRHMRNCGHASWTGYSATIITRRGNCADGAATTCTGRRLPRYWRR